MSEIKHTPEQMQAVRDALAAALGDAYDCTRVWAAWGCGTMGPDDFVPVAEDDDRLHELTIAALDAAASVVTPVSRLADAAPELLDALREGRRAIGEHTAPNDCYATGPVSGDAFRDLVQCPACSFIAMYDAAIAKATGTRS